MTKRAISAKISTEIYERLATAAKRSDRSMSWIIERAIENHLDQAAAGERAILDGIADITAGRTRPHTEVKAWAAGLALECPPTEGS